MARAVVFLHSTAIFLCRSAIFLRRSAIFLRRSAISGAESAESAPCFLLTIVWVYTVHYKYLLRI